MIPSFVLIPFSFSIFLILILLLGESFLSWYLIGLFALWMLFALKSFDFSWIKTQKTPLFLWGIFLLLSLTSLFFTHSFPLSLENVASYVFVFLVFIVALSFGSTGFNKERFSLFIILIGFVLSLLSLFFLFNRELAASLPGMNLIYATYGHNHLAAFLLLVLPLVWQKVFLYADKNVKLYYHGMLAAAGLITLTLLFSFGRVALLLGVLQLSFIWLSVRIQAKKFSRQPLLKFIMPTIILLFAVVFGFKMYFSYTAGLNGNFVCPVPSWLSDKVCKPLDAELRPLYFLQAVRAVKTYPLTGYGPGTFELISRKYKQLPYASSSYVHNHFLQVSAEMGVFAGIVFSLLIITLFWRAGQRSFRFQSAEKKLFSFDQALFIGSFTLFVNAFFDFDWGYLGIFSLTMFFLGLILRQQSKDDSENRVFYIPVTVVLRIFLFSLLLLSAVYLLIEILTRSNFTGLAFDIFPYFSEHRKVFEAEKNLLSADQKNRFLQIYKYDSAAYFYKKQQAETQQQERVKEDLYSIDPWQNLHAKNIDTYLNNNNYLAADQNLTALIEVVEKAEREFGYELGFTKKFSLLQQRLKIADYYLETGKPEKAAQYYLWSKTIEPWIFDLHLPPINDQTPPDVLATFLLGIISSDGSQWGKNHQRYFEWQERVLMNTVSEGDEQAARFWFTALNQQFGGVEQYLWETSSETLLNSLGIALETKNVEKMKKRISLWFELWQLYSHQKSQDNFSIDRYENQLSEFQVALSQLMLMNADNQLVNEKDAIQSGISGTADIEERLQWAADGFIALEDYQWAEKTLIILGGIKGENYWQTAQLGHFYVLLSHLATTEELKLSWRDKAIKAYEKCLASFNGGHDDCARGKANLEAGEPLIERYFQVSQIIRGEKNWEDFTD